VCGDVGCRRACGQLRLRLTAPPLLPLPAERALFTREVADGLYHPVLYLAWRTAEELLIISLITLATSAAVFYAASLSGSMLLFWVCNMASLANGLALSFLVSPGTDPPALPGHAGCSACLLKSRPASGC
jgi:hypothetical protein